MARKPITSFLTAIATVAMSAYALCCLPLVFLAGLLLAYGETAQGRLFAGSVLIGLPSSVLLWVAWRRGWRRAIGTAAALGGLAVLLLAIDFGLTPDGQPLPGAPVRSCFTGATVYRRASLANLVPEMDQLILASYVMPFLDSLMDEPNTQELRGQIRQVYGEMRQAPEFECLGSVLGQTYADLFLGQRPVGHFYEYIPRSAGRQRLPTVIFLHGSLGNFKGYLWVWKRLADEYGFAIVAPTFGSGNWDQPGGEDAIEQARRYCASHPRLDPARLYLAGLSNGGRGVCLGARRAPNAYRGLIFISPVMDTDLLLTDSFLAAWKGKPLLILHGTADNRIPAYCIREAAALLEHAGLRVETHFFEGQTHFLLFTIRGQVCGRIGEWLKADYGAQPQR